MSDAVEPLDLDAERTALLAEVDRLRAAQYAPVSAPTMSDTGAAERAAAYASGEWCGECRYGIAEDPPCCTPCPCCGGHSGEHAPRITLAAAAPTVEEVHDRLELHDLAPQPRDGVMALDEDTEWWCFGCERVVGAGTDYDAVRHDHQAEQVAALWGAR